MKYTKTLLVSSVGSFDGIKPGQWIVTETNQRGQYLGKSKSGAVVVRWQNGKFCDNGLSDAFNNKWLRNFAKGVTRDNG